MNEADFRALLARNLSDFRKKAGLTQAEAASRISYSDKSISKWERGDGLPDAFVLTKLAENYGCTLNDLTGIAPAEEESAREETPEEVPAEETTRRRGRRSPFTVCLALGAVWLVATVIFSILCMLERRPFDAPYMVFLYAIPASFLVLELFASLWRMPAILHLLFSSGALWTITMCIHLNMRERDNVFLLYVIAAVAQMLGIFAMGLYWDMIHMPKGHWEALIRKITRKGKKMKE